MDNKSYWNKFLDFFGLNDDDEYDEKIRPDQKKVVSIHKNQEFKVAVYHPDSFIAVKKIADELKGKKPVIINLENLEHDLARRIIDFVSGASYGLEGNIQKVGEAVFLFTPDNISIDGEAIKKDINKSFLWS